MGSSPSPSDPVRFAIVGGSGLYELAGLEDAREIRVDTPFGHHSEPILVGGMAGRGVAFLARHGRHHTLLPTEVNYRANVFALKSLGVERILSASAVGSMRETIHPRDVVLVDQFIDRTRQRPSTFFGEGLVAHVAFADPVCPVVRARMLEAARNQGAQAHDGGTYLCIEGPTFSTRAESMLYRSWGVDVIGMTNLPEARLAREAEICYATLALVTDYDCWHEEEEDVSVTALLDNLKANSALAAAVVREAIAALPGTRGPECGCGEALRHGLITAREAISEQTVQRLKPILHNQFGPEDEPVS